MNTTTTILTMAFIGSLNMTAALDVAKLTGGDLHPGAQVKRKLKKIKRRGYDGVLK